MHRVDSDESVPDAPERVQLKLCLYTQHKAVLLQLRIKGRPIKPVLVESMDIIIFEPVDPKPHRDGILCMQAYGLLFHRAAYPANIGWRDEFVPAAGGHRVLQPVRLIFTYLTSPSYFVLIPFRVVKYSLIICTIRIT